MTRLLPTRCNGGGFQTETLSQVVVPLPLGAEDGGGEVVGGLRMLG
jgi:hypothetical protein